MVRLYAEETWMVGVAGWDLQPSNKVIISYEAWSHHTVNPSHPLHPSQSDLQSRPWKGFVSPKKLGDIPYLTFKIFFYQAIWTRLLNNRTFQYFVWLWDTEKKNDCSIEGATKSETFGTGFEGSVFFKSKNSYFYICFSLQKQNIHP